MPRPPPHPLPPIPREEIFFPVFPLDFHFVSERVIFNRTTTLQTTDCFDSLGNVFAFDLIRYENFFDTFSERFVVSAIDVSFSFYFVLDTLVVVRKEKYARRK